MKIHLPDPEVLLALAVVSLLALAIFYFPAALQQAKQDAIRQLQDAGYSNPVITGVRLLGCSEDDTFRIGFTASGNSDRPVSGVVCSAPLKGATIRLD